MSLLPAIRARTAVSINVRIASVCNFGRICIATGW